MLSRDGLKPGFWSVGTLAIALSLWAMAVGASHWGQGTHGHPDSSCRIDHANLQEGDCHVVAVDGNGENDCCNACLLHKFLGQTLIPEGDIPWIGETCTYHHFFTEKPIGTSECLEDPTRGPPASC